MSEKHDIAIETVVILAILFVIYVAGDLMTTIWLIGTHPEGIGGEKNPLGVLIFEERGVFGLIAAKVIIFISLSVMTFILEFHYKHIKNVMIISNLTILGLMALSLIVVTVNVMMIYTLSLQEGSYESTFLLRTYIVIFAITLAGLILLPKFVPSSLGIVEGILALVVIFGPLAFAPGLYQYLLAENIINFSAYIAANAVIIGMMIYAMNKLYKHIIPKKIQKN